MFFVPVLMCLTLLVFGGLSQAQTATMKAVVIHSYDGPDVLKVEDVPRPSQKKTRYSFASLRRR